MEKETTRYQITSVDLLPAARACLILFLILGILIGIFAFLVFPHPASAGLSFSTRLLSALLFAGLYSAALTGVVALLLFLYNVLIAPTRWALTFSLSKHFPGKE